MGFFSGLLEKGLDTVMNVAKEMTDSRPTLEGGFPEKFYFDGDKSVIETVVSQLRDLKEQSLYFAFTPTKRMSAGGLLDSWECVAFGTKKILMNSSKHAYEYVVDGYVYGIRRYRQKEKLDAGDERKISYTDKLSFYIGKAPSEEELKKPDERVFEKTCSYIHNFSYEEERIDLVNKLFQEKVIDLTSADIKRMYEGLVTYKSFMHCGSTAVLKMQNSGDENGILKKLEEKLQNSQIDEILEQAKDGVDNQSVVLADNEYSVHLADGSCLEIDRVDCPEFQYVNDSVYVKYTNASGNYIAMLYVEETAFSVRFCTGNGEIENIISFYKETYAGGRTIKTPTFPESLGDAVYFVMNSDELAGRIASLKIKLMNLYEAKYPEKIRDAYLSSEKAAEEKRLANLAEKKKKVAQERSELAKKKAKEEEEKAKEDKARQTKKALDDF